MKQLDGCLTFFICFYYIRGKFVHCKLLLHNPTNLIFGAGKLNELSRQKLPGKKALLLISSGKSVKTYGTLARVEEQLKQAGVSYVVCDNIHENPSKEVVMEAAAAAKENDCDFQSPDK